MTYAPRLHCLFPNMVDSTSFYRGVGPMSKIRHLMDVRVSSETNISWGSLAWSDILFAQRPWGKAFHKACVIAMNNRIPIWIDYDDYLLDIPDWNPSKRYFSNSHDQKEMLEMIEMASVVTVTTEALKKKFLKHNPNVFIIPNAFDDYLFKFEKCFSSNQIINWRGSTTHSEDLKTIIPGLRNVQSELDKRDDEDWMFHFIGDDCSILKGLVRFKETKQLDPIEYFHFIKQELNPLIQLIPLVDCEFNHSKSNIAWIEGIYSGAVSIAPGVFEEFRRPGCFNYSSPEDFEQILLTCTTEKLEEFYNEGYDFIDKNLRLSIVNKMRVDVIMALMNKTK